VIPLPVTGVSVYAISRERPDALGGAFGVDR
jgi:hypothetical protein